MTDASPLPAAPHPRRWLLRTFLALLALLALAAALVLWLVGTAPGRDATLAQLLRALPPGSLSWERAEGTLRGPLVLHGLRYRDGELEFSARRVALSAELVPAFSRRLQLTHLDIQGARLQLPADDEPFEMPRWPEVLPALELPLDMRSREVSVDGLLILQGEQTLLDASRLRASELHLAPGRFAVKSFSLHSTLGQLTLAGSYAPAEAFRTALEGRWVGPAPEEGPAARLQFSVGGDVERFTLDVQGNAPEPLSLALSLGGASEAPTWTLSAQSEGLQPALFGAAQVEPLRFVLDAQGTGGEAQLQGELAQGEQTVGIAPSKLSLEEGELRAAPLRLQLDAGAVEITGTARLEGERPEFDLRLASEKLTLLPESGEAGAVPVQASGAVQASGHFDDWSVDGEALLLRNGQRAQVQVQGHGNREQLDMARVQADTPGGGLTGSGRVRWAPQLALQLDATLRGFNPGFFAPDYPGAVSGQLQLQAERDDAGLWRGDLRAANLGGQLRGRALGGRLQADWDGSRGRGDADLRLGASRVSARGSFGARYDLNATFAPLNLPDLLAGAEGQLTGTLGVRGATGALDFRFDLDGRNLAWAGQSAGELRLQGQLPARGQGGEARLQAAQLALGGLALDTLALTTTGSQTDLRLRADADSANGALAAQAQLSRRGNGWRGRIESLRLQPQPGPALVLEDGANFRYGPNLIELERSCLAVEQAGGRLCLSATGQSVRVEGEALPLALAQPWIPTDENVPLFIEGLVDLDGRVQRGRDGLWRGEAQLRSARGSLRLEPGEDPEIFGYRDLSLILALAGNQLNATLEAGLADEGRVSAEVRTGLDAGAALAGSLSLDVRDLTWLELFSPDIASPTGRLQGRLGLAGTRSEPVLSGQARLSALEAELPALGVKLREGEFTLVGEPDGTTRLEGQLRSGEGWLRLDGSLNFRDSQAPLQLTLVGENVTVASTAELFAVASPDMSVRLVDEVLEVRGSVTLPEARLDLELLNTDVEISPDVVVLDPLDEPRERSLPLDLDFGITLGENVRLKGFGLDGLMTGSLALRDRPGRAARASGVLELTGTYRAYGRVLTLQRARLGFANSPIDNPTLDILAEREFEEVTVGVQIRGTAQRPETTVVSDPAMNTDEALSWLVLGRPLRSAGGADAVRVDAARMALNAGGNVVVQQLGAQLGLDVAGVSDSRNLGGATLTVGKYLSPNVIISYGVSLIGTGQVVTLRYLLRRGFDVTVESGRENAASVNWRTER